MPSIITLLAFEEGWREKPYIDTEGYPTVGYGFKIGPRGAPLSHYTFTLPREAGNAWMLAHVARMLLEMRAKPSINKALVACLEPNTDASPMYNPRGAVLVSMAYQMGVDGLVGFRNTLMAIANKDWFTAETGMLKSRWASQTPKRARRHAAQMRSGEWQPEYL